ncbi:MAG: SHIRT domain-containing protein, partial [Aerococcaceae bacterium]|nr:SHIRT domain-containing protein [Aerococcaceae bacterium]
MFKEKSRFSIRKYKAYGACSVLLGVATLSLANPVQAEEVANAPQLDSADTTLTLPAEATAPETVAENAEEVSASALTDETVLPSENEAAVAEAPLVTEEAPVADVTPVVTTTAPTTTPRRSAAMPRPANEGQPLTSGTGFRAAPTDPAVAVTDTASLKAAIANNQNITIANNFDITETIEATGYTGSIVSDTEKVLTLANTLENMFAFSNSTVIFDKISLNAADKGRHIWTSGSTVTLKNSSLTNGTTEHFTEKVEAATGRDRQVYTGGSIYAIGSTVTTENVTFENNHTKAVLPHATSGMPHGGAIYLTNGTLNVVGGSFKNNYTGRQMGANTPGGEGGAIKVDGNSVLNINAEGAATRTTFEGNHTNHHNGGGNQGGAIEVTTARAYIYNSDFKVGTPVDSGGAIKFEDSREAVVKDSTFVLDGIRGNLTTGGAITSQGSKTTIERSTFKLNNSRVYETGGLIHVGGTGEFNLKDSTLEGNGASWNSVWQNGAAQKGGAIVFYAGSTVTALIENSSIKNFMVDGNGAAISVGKDLQSTAAVNLTIRNSILENNAGYTWDNNAYGGQIFIGEGNTVLIEGGKIQGSTTSNTAAGIYNNGHLTVTGGAQIISNRAYQMVGGIYNNGYLKVDDATIRNTYGDWSSSIGNHILNNAEHAGVNIYADKDVIITPNAKIIGGDVRVHDGASSIILTGTLTNHINVSISEQPKTTTSTHHNVAPFAEDDQRYIGYTVAKGDGTYNPVASDADKLHYVSKPGTGIYAQPVSELADNTSIGKWDFVFNHETNTVVVGQRVKVVYDANGGNFANIGTTNGPTASALISATTDATTSTSLQRVYKSNTPAVPASETPTRDGYNFVGWFTEADKDRVKELASRQNLPVEFDGVFATNSPQTDIIDPNILKAYAGWIRVFDVTHRFEKAAGVDKDLPQDIIDRITTDKNQTDVENGTTVTPTATIDTTPYIDEVNDGTWTFVA